MEHKYPSVETRTAATNPEGVEHIGSKVEKGKMSKRVKVDEKKVRQLLQERSADCLQRRVRAKPTLKDLVTAAHAAGVKVSCHLEPILRVEVSRGMEADLNTLVRSGLFGVSASEAARRILEEWLWNNTMRIAALRPNADIRHGG